MGKTNFHRLRTLYRSDMEDLTGTLMCPRCAEDAFDSGLFYTKGGV